MNNVGLVGLGHIKCRIFPIKGKEASSSIKRIKMISIRAFNDNQIRTQVRRRISVRWGIRLHNLLLCPSLEEEKNAELLRRLVITGLNRFLGAQFLGKPISGTVVPPRTPSISPMSKR